MISNNLKHDPKSANFRSLATGISVILEPKRVCFFRVDACGKIH